MTKEPKGWKTNPWKKKTLHALIAKTIVFFPFSATSKNNSMMTIFLFQTTNYAKFHAVHFWITHHHHQVNALKLAKEICSQFKAILPPRQGPKIAHYSSSSSSRLHHFYLTQKKCSIKRALEPTRSQKKWLHMLQ